MLTVDLGLLQRARRLEINERIGPESPLLAGSEARLAEPLAVQAEVQQAGADVVVRGRMSGVVEVDCRRCLKAVRQTLDEELTLLYVEGLDPLEAERQEAYPLPEKGRVLDLGAAVREHVLLAAPRFALCDAACKGLCPKCGVDLNDTTCACRESMVDERWAALRRLGSK
jgi:uncharacterized protein